MKISDTTLAKIIIAACIIAAMLLNNCCNDLPDDFWENWPIEEIQELHKEFHDWNGDPEEYSPTWLHLGDSSLMAFMAHKIIQND